ncbi:hypothetical protein G5I_13470 [Acromyrmex echinatior]|uniref:Uncharacterized protein n=1 Tax=Acromyrmex echinatior TaxID=103372 RepID=F4X538_ACREC|nr:hypothetical protein G5I_13470 [Acromyrmex echinatior]
MHVSVESGQPWSCGGKEKKDGKKECRWFTVIKYRRTRACAEIVRRAGGKAVYETVAVLRKKRRRTRDNGEWRKSYLHQDSTQFSSYHTANGKFALLASPEATSELKDI